MEENEFWTMMISGLMIGVCAILLFNQLTIIPQLRMAGQSICDDTYGKGKTTFVNVDQWFEKVNCREVEQKEEKPFDGIKVVKLKTQNILK